MKLTLHKHDLQTIQNAPKKYGRLFCKLREVKSPIHEDFRGYECVAAIPNKAKFNKFRGEYQTSYHLKYLVASRYVLKANDISRAKFEAALRSFPFHVKEVIWED